MTLDGGTLGFTGSFTTGRGITLTANNGTVDVATGQTVETAALLGSGTLTKTGTGTLAVDFGIASGATINGGALQIEASNWVGQITNNATLILHNDTDTMWTNSILGSGNVVKTGAGTLDATFASWSGTTTISAGTLVTESDRLNDPIVNNAALVFNDAQSGSFAFNGTAVSGTGTVTIENAQGTRLFGANTYSGGTVLKDSVVHIFSDQNLGAANGTLTLDNATLGTLDNITINRAITLGPGGGTFNPEVPGSITLAGPIGGSGGLAKIGDNTLILSGTNTYTGGTTVTGGTLQVGADANLGAAGKGVTLDGGTLSTTASIDTTRTVTLNAGGGTFDVGTGTLRLETAIAGTGGFTVASGTLALTHGAQNNGAITVDAGATLFLNQGTSQNITDNGSVSFNAFSGTGTLASSISGSGTVSFSGQFSSQFSVYTLTGSNSYTGGTFANNSVIQGTTDSLQGDIHLTSSTVAFNQDTDGTYSGRITGSGLSTVGAGLIKNGAGTLTLTGNNAYGGGTKINTGTLQINSASLTGNITDNAALVFDQATDGTFAGVIGGTGSITKKNAGTLVLTGTNTYTGGTTVTGGTLQVSADANLGNAAGGLTLDGGTLSTTTSFTTSRTVTLNAGGGIFDLGITTLRLDNSPTGTGGFTVASGTLALTHGAQNNGAITVDAGATLFLNQGTSQNITDNGSVSFNAFSGTGTLASSISGSGTVSFSGQSSSQFSVYTLTGSNSYTGGTFANNSVIQGTTDSLQGNIHLTSSSVAFNQDTDGTYSGRITGSGLSTVGAGLIKNGAGTLTLTGNNAYGGGTKINAGTLQINAASLTGNITDNAALVFDQATDGTFAGVIGGTGSITKKNAGTLVLTGTNTYTGGTTVTGGTLEGDTTSLHGNITNNANVTFNQTSDGAYAGVISGTGSLTKIGGAIVNLTAPNVFTGPTNVQEGTLAVSGNGSIAASSGLNVSFGATFDASQMAMTFAGTVANQGTVVGGTGHNALELTGAVTGSGSFRNNVIFNGSYGPGNSPAEVSLDHATLGDNNSLIMELGGTIRGTQYDAIDALTINLGGTLDVKLYDLGGGRFVPRAGDTFDLISAALITGMFTNFDFSNAQLSDGLRWDWQVFDRAGLEVFALTVAGSDVNGGDSGVPAPSALLIFVCGTICLVAMRKGNMRG